MDARHSTHTITQQREAPPLYGAGNNVGKAPRIRINLLGGTKGVDGVPWGASYTACQPEDFQIMLLEGGV